MKHDIPNLLTLVQPHNQHSCWSFLCTHNTCLWQCRFLKAFFFGVPVNLSEQIDRIDGILFVINVSMKRNKGNKWWQAGPCTIVFYSSYHIFLLWGDKWKPQIEENQAPLCNIPRITRLAFITIITAIPRNNMFQHLHFTSFVLKITDINNVSIVTSHLYPGSGTKLYFHSIMHLFWNNR